MSTALILKAVFALFFSACIVLIVSTNRKIMRQKAMIERAKNDPEGFLLDEYEDFLKKLTDMAIETHWPLPLQETMANLALMGDRATTQLPHVFKKFECGAKIDGETHTVTISITLNCKTIKLSYPDHLFHIPGVVTVHGAPNKE